LKHNSLHRPYNTIHQFLQKLPSSPPKTFIKKVEAVTRKLAYKNSTLYNIIYKEKARHNSQYQERNSKQNTQVEARDKLPNSSYAPKHTSERNVRTKPSGPP
jgi:hypothetical protein